MQLSRALKSSEPRSIAQIIIRKTFLFSIRIVIKDVLELNDIGADESTALYTILLPMSVNMKKIISNSIEKEFVFLCFYLRKFFFFV